MMVLFWFITIFVLFFAMFYTRKQQENWKKYFIVVASAAFLGVIRCVFVLNESLE